MSEGTTDLITNTSQFGSDVEAEYAETINSFCNDVSREARREILGHGPKRADGSYVEGTTMTIGRLDARVAAVVS